ncbi:MAG: serine/threonine protein kinase, partial [Planctomycetaceae bacterium]
MITTECPPTESLSQLSSGRIGSTEDENALWDHVRDCVDCQANLDILSDADDSLIGSLRNPDGESPFQNESTCRSAILKALGALAGTGEGGADDADRDAPGVAGDLLAKEPWPRSIGEYEIVRLLGRGGMGSVFLARHTKLGRQVALKLLGGYRLADPRMRQRFDAEMRAIGHLSHPNVVTAHDARDIDGTAVLITEFIDGLDLAQLVSRTGPLAIADACEVIRQVAVALAYVNERGFVHRDVKPSNIMLGRGGEVKLLDLGLARFLGSDESAPMTGTGQTMGTADFIAPEQVTDSRSVDIRADIYSLGCTLFHLLTGSAPFADEAHSNSFAKLTAHVAEPPPKLSQRLSTAPASLVQLIDAMLAKNPDHRPSTPLLVAEQLAGLADGHDLRRLADRGITAPPADTAPPIATQASQAALQPWMRRPVSRSLAIASGLIGILFGFVLGIVISITLPDGSRMKVRVPDGSDIAIDFDRSEASAVGQADRAIGNGYGMGMEAGGDMMGAGAMGDMGMSGMMASGDYGGEMMGGEMSGMGSPGMEMGGGMDGSFVDPQPWREFNLPGMEMGADMYGGGGGMNGGMDMGMMGGEGAVAEEMAPSSVAYSGAGPLAFAILLEPDAISAEQLQQKERMTRLGMHPATGNEFGSWYEVADGVDVPFEFAIDGKRYTLVGIGQDSRIRWEELQSMVELAFDSTPASTLPAEDPSTAAPMPSMQLTFRETLPERMRYVTSKHIGKQLAVIVDGVIVSAPRIRSEISSAA